MMTTWTESCPLEGRCQECGLAYAWGELINGRLHAARWLVEHAPMVRLVVAIPASMVAAMVPWLLWRWTRMEHAIGVSRLVVLVVAAFLTIPVFIGVHVGLDVHQALGRMVANRSWVGITSTKAGTAASPPTGWVVTQVDVSVLSRAMVILTAVSAPFGHQQIQVSVATSPFATVLASAPNPIPAKGPTLAGTAPILSPASFWIDAARKWSWVATLAIPVAACSSLAAFASLPIARRRAKVRWAHLARALAYLLTTTPIVAFLIGFGPPVSWGSDGAAVLLFVTSLVLVVFWEATARTYLRMEHPVPVALSVAAIGVLVMCVTLVFWSLAHYSTTLS